MDSDRQSKITLGRRVRRLLVCLVLLGAFLAPTGAAWAVRGDGSQVSRSYDASQAGHPIKILYYALYPVGFVFNSLVLKPAWWLGQRQPFRTFFGVDAIRSGL